MAPQAPEKTGPSESETINIVRYPNRRFYDRSQGRYVTLQEIAAVVREGKTVSIQDSKTREDLTSIILTQILLEYYPERMALFPVPLLHLMIRTNDVVLGLLRDYFRQSLSYVELWQRASAFNPMTASLAWFQSLLPTPPASGSSPPAAGTAQASAEDLAQRLAEMERRLNALEPLADKNESEPEGRPRPRRERKGRGNRQ